MPTVRSRVPFPFDRPIPHPPTPQSLTHTLSSPTDVSTPARRRTAYVVIRAEQQQQQEETPSIDEDKEARLEALEASIRAKKGAQAANNRAASNASSQPSPGPYAEWKEGELFPEGWDEMDPLKKMTELYVGKRGFLFWSAKLATGGVVVLAGAWVFFRFIGPALGLYQLSNNMSTPNF